MLIKTILNKNQQNQIFYNDNFIRMYFFLVFVDV